MKVLKMKRRAGSGLKYVNGMVSGPSPLCREASVPGFTRYMAGGTHDEG